MMSVPLHLVKALKDGDALAAKMEPRTEGGKAWVFVWPRNRWSEVLDKDFEDSEESEKEVWNYYVISFEEPKGLSERPSGSAITKRDLTYCKEYHLMTLEEVDDVLLRLVGDPSKFRRFYDWIDPTD